MAVLNTASSFHHAPSDWSEGDARELAEQFQPKVQKLGHPVPLDVISAMQSTS